MRGRAVSVLMEYDKLVAVCWLTRGCTGRPLEN